MITMKMTMPDLKTSRRRIQEGTALTEFVVVAVVLTPLMFGIPMIGKMIDLKQTTVQASRYSAWETTVNAGGTPAQTLDQRFFSDASAPINESAPAANSLWGPQESLAADGNASTSPLAGSFMSATAVEVGGDASMDTPSAYAPGSYNGVAYAPAADRSAAAHLGEAVDFLGGYAEQFGGSWDGLDTDGLIRGQASVTMQGNGWLDAQTITQDTIIMNDNWSVSGAEQARDRARAFVPAGVLNEVGKGLGIVGLVPGMRELKIFGGDSGRRVFGYVDVEPLPPSEDLTPRQLKTYEE